MHPVLKSLSLLSLILITSFPAFSQRTTLLIGSWSDESYHGRESFDKILVVGIARSTLVRRVFEDDMVKKLQKKKVEAIASLDELPPEEQLNKETFQKYFSNEEIDAVLVTRLVEEHVLPDIPHPENEGAGNFYGYYESSYVPPSREGGLSMTRTAKVETNLYDTETAHLVWTCQTKSFEQGDNLEKILNDVSKIVAKELKKYGYLK